MSVCRQQIAEGKNLVEEGRASTGTANSCAHCQVDERQCSSEVRLLDRDWLTTETIDLLADRQQDWIGLLQHDWKLELYNLNLLGIKDEKGCLKHSCLSVTELVFLIREARYQPLTIFYQQHWGYTCCLQIAGLGRVRLVISFNHPQCFGRSAVFVTNRLDWSPRHIVAHWIQHHSTTNIYGRNPSFKFYPENTLQLA